LTLVFKGLGVFEEEINTGAANAVVDEGKTDVAREGPGEDG
jgi:hypothetical protein